MITEIFFCDSKKKSTSVRAHALEGEGGGVVAGEQSGEGNG